MKDLKASTVIAGIALFVVIGGTATAASGLINGKKIKPGTITAKQIKNKTITKAKLAPATVKSLRGAKGPRGHVGKTGAAGPAGSDGIVDPLFAEKMDQSLPGNSESVIPLTMNVEPGTYMLTAKANIWSISGPNSLQCSIWTDETHGVDTAWMDGDTNETGNLAMMAVAEVQEKIELRCSADEGAANSQQLKLIAVPVQG